MTKYGGDSPTGAKENALSSGGRKIELCAGGAKKEVL